ncbi:MAG: FAD-dependent oxidoreductase [Sandaracinaceae bacterium]|nr:FAD-dependent oxidoreductase [Sandaracinaceae bacterium]
MRVVIVGNGVAGIEAALALRAREPGATITIVSEESDHFFSRTALMWIHSGQLRHEETEPYERDLYARERFERVRARAVGLDPEAHTVRLAGGLAPLPYDRLLVACGSRPRPTPWPGAELRGVGHFVTHQDLAWLEREVWGGPSRGGSPPRPDAHLAATDERSPYRPRPDGHAARGGPPRHPVVIGGGLVGIEAVEVLLAAKLTPRFLVREEWFWPLALDRAEADWITGRLRAHGVLVHLGEHVEALEGEGTLARVRTDRASYDADVCVVAIGVVPNTDWIGDALARDAGGGVLVGPGLETSAEDVFAAGDCASVRWFHGARMPEPLWYTARAQGRVAGRRLAGDRADYARGVFYNSSKLADVEHTTVGLVSMNVEGERNWRFEERGAVRSTLRVVLAGERVVGMNALGRRWDHAVWIRWIEERRSLAYVLSHLAEASFDTELVPPLVVPRDAREAPPEGPAPSVIDAPLPAPEA